MDRYRRHQRLKRFCYLITTYIRHIMSKSYKRFFVYALSFFTLTFLVDISGVLRHPFERDYHTQFSYPLDVPNFFELVHAYRTGQPVSHKPINYLYSTLQFVHDVEERCGESPYQLLILVKSSVDHFERRIAIRNTWGNPKRFSDVKIKTVFLLGLLTPEEAKRIVKMSTKRLINIEDGVEEETSKYKDIVRGNFTDSYYNNTIKTMMGMKWAAEICPNFKFAFIVDDDMYVSIKNLLKYIRHPAAYPDYWEQRKIEAEQKQKEAIALNPNAYPEVSKREMKFLRNVNPIEVFKNSPSDFNIELAPETKLFSGYVFFVPPHRHKIGTKWFLTLAEYPYDYFPPYVTAAAVILSKSALLDIYYASFYTEPFRFDDVYLALCAKKMFIEPFHTDHIQFWVNKKDPSHPQYQYMIASHGYDDPREMVQFWIAQKTLGHA